MKYFGIFYVFAIAMCMMLALVHSFSVSDSNVKCVMNCDLEDFRPVCGTDDAGERKSFHNLCILKTENCLRQLSFQKTHEGKCP